MFKSYTYSECYVLIQVMLARPALFSDLRIPGKSCETSPEVQLLSVYPKELIRN